MPKSKDNLSYSGVHVWLYRKYGSADFCEINSKHLGRIEYANISGLYLKKRSDYIKLCKRDHEMFDNKKYSIQRLRQIDMQRNIICEKLPFLS